MHALSPVRPMPRWAWLAVALELVTAALAVPVGWSFLSDPTGSGMGVPVSWIQDSVFGDYFVPGLYLFGVNGLGMLVLAGLTVLRQPIAPWLTGALGIGLMIWIGVQVVVMPEIMWLQPVFFGVGLAMAVVALFGRRHTGQL